MKKTFLALSLMVAAATIAHGAAIKWAIGGAIDANADIDTSVGSFVLAYIGTTSGIGVDADTFNTGVGTSYSVVDTGSWTDFYSSRQGTYSKAKSTTVDDVANATYQIFYVNNGVYSLVNDPTQVTMAISIDPTTGGASTSAYVNGVSNGSSAMYATGGSTTAIASVPEPSTAALALAGLALLLKRRKA